MAEPGDILGRQRWLSEGAGFYGTRIGMLARASGGSMVQRGLEEPTAWSRYPRWRNSTRRRVSPLAAISQVFGTLRAAASIPPAGTKRESRRGSAQRRRRESGLLVRGTNAAWQEAAQASRTKDVTRSVSVRVRGVDPFSVRGPSAYRAMGAAGAGNALISDLVDRYYAAKRRAEHRAQRRADILGVGRRGADATRPFQPRAVPGRTGAAATRPAPAASPAPANAPAYGPVRRPVASPVPVGSPDVRTSPTPAAVPRAATAPRTAPALATAVRVNWDPMRMLLNAIAPARNAARATAQAAQTLAARVMRTSGARVTNPLPAWVGGANLPAPLTALNSGPVQSPMSAAAPNPQADPCARRAPEKKRRSEPTCRNPVISRSVKDGVLTTKRRLTCRQFKPR